MSQNQRWLRAGGMTVRQVVAALAVTSETAAALVTTAAILMSRCLPMRPARRITSPFSQCAIPLPAEYLATYRADSA
jgi:hypothetical protein